MSDEHATLAPGLRMVLDNVAVSEDLASAKVSDRLVEGDSPHELRRALSSALYEEFHAGLRTDAGPMPFQTREARFEQVLAEAVPHRATSAPAVLCAPIGADDEPEAKVLVERDGVRVWMPRAAVRTPGPVEAGTPVMLEVSALRPALSPGFFLIDGSIHARPGGPTLRVYVHLTEHDHAAAVWSRVLGILEDRQVPYRAKVLSSRVLFPRRDGLVTYLPCRAGDEAPGAVHGGVVADPAGVVGGIAEGVAGLDGVGGETSAFTQRLGPGLAVAWEPDDKRKEMRGLSYGQHRASVIAQGLMASAREQTAREDAVVEALLEAGIDPAQPARNLSSPELFEGAGHEGG